MPYSLLSQQDVETLVHFDLFKDTVGRDELMKLFADGKVRELKHREILISVGAPLDSFALVLDGAVKLLKHSPKGEDIIMHFALPGDLIGALLMNQTQQKSYPLSAKAMGPSRVLVLPKKTFSQAWLGNLTIMHKINQLLYRRMHNIQDDKIMSTSPLKKRIANLLLRHLNEGKTASNLKISLTRQEIADSLGVAVESVIRAMRELQAEGVTEKLGDKQPELIHVPKLVKLLDLN